jgi:hypothetical protein
MTPPQNILNEILYGTKFISITLQIGILLGEDDALPIRVIEHSR